MSGANSKCRRVGVRRGEQRGEHEDEGSSGIKERKGMMAKGRGSDDFREDIFGGLNVTIIRNPELRVES